jgi:tetratricopeptide (TPR) repeat protein
MGRAGAALLLAVFLAASPRAAAAGAPEPETLTVLDVPFLPQSEQLCGGAAAAMVLRYWGARDVLAEDFASLLDVSVAGIRGDALVEEVRRRRWMAHSLRGDHDVAKAHLARGRPLIALIEDRPGRYHYVVLVAWLDGHVILHDPARAPFRVLADSAFAKAWAAADFWTLLILPDSQTSSAEGHALLGASHVTVLESSADGCGALVQQGVRLAQSGDHDSAEAALSTALELCPTSAAAARELAGLRFVQSRWQEAAQLATRAAARAPDDAHAWRLLASSRFVQNDVDGALQAWNRIGEPRIDLLRVEGLNRTPYAIVEGLLGLTPRSELTATKLRRARRRLAMLPAASASRVAYRPVPGGLAEVDAAIVERSPFPGPVAMGVFAAHASTEREFLLDVAAPSGGTRWIVSWRWWAARPRVGLSLLAPAAFGRSGLWRLDGLWEQQPYVVSGRPDDEALTREDRTRLALSYADWTGGDTRVALGAAFDRWDRARSYVGMFGSVEQRLMGDRLAARARGTFWPTLNRAARFGSSGFDLAWRSSSTSTSGREPLLLGRAGVESASARAPFGIWPGADIGHARDVLARAHPLLNRGIIGGGIFGRTLAHSTVEFQATMLARGLTHVGMALFTDVARAWHSLEHTAGDRTQIDIGAGLRVRVAGHPRTLRIDVAHGVRDGRTVISAGWQPPWPE